MFVLCPHCQFLVAVDPVTGAPPARCPRCDGAVSPSATAEPERQPEPRAETAPEPSPEQEPEPAVADGAVAPVPDDATDDIEAPQPAPEPAPPSAPIAAEALNEDAESGADPARADSPPAIADVASSARPRTRAPSFAHPAAAEGPRGARRHWRMPLAIVGLTLLLVLQMVLADRAQLAADARWRPAMEALCNALRCGLPPWHEPAAFTLVDRDVRPDPRSPGVLHVRARFRNDARWPQPWPRVQLTLSDVDGRVAGARLFAPREYGAPAVTRNPIASGQVADIVMDVIEPAPGIVAFTFDFR